MSGILAQPSNGPKLLWILKGANMNVTTDQVLAQVGYFTSFIIDKIVVTNASTSLTTAAGGIYGAASKAAPIIVAASQTYASLTTSTKILNPTLAAAAQEVLSAQAAYLSLTTAQGTAATADVYIFGVTL